MQAHEQRFTRDVTDPGSLRKSLQQAATSAANTSRLVQGPKAGRYIGTRDLTDVTGVAPRELCCSSINAATCNAREEI